MDVILHTIARPVENAAQDFETLDASTVPEKFDAVIMNPPEVTLAKATLAEVRVPRPKGRPLQNRSA